MLLQTRELLDHEAPDLAALLAAVLTRSPLPKPPDHRADTAADMFELVLTGAQVAAICSAVDGALASGRRTSDTQSRGLGGFREAWQEYLRSFASSPD